MARDYPALAGPAGFRDWHEAGTVRVAFAHWTAPCPDGRAELASEARVRAGRPRCGASPARALERGRPVRPPRGCRGAHDGRPPGGGERRSRGRLPELEAGERRHLVDERCAVPDRTLRRSRPASTCCERISTRRSRTSGTGSRCALFLAGLALELEPIARGSHPHVPAVRVDAYLSSGDRRNEAQHPLAQPHHDGCRGGAHTEYAAAARRRRPRPRPCPGRRWPGPTTSGRQSRGPSSSPHTRERRPAAGARPPMHASPSISAASSTGCQYCASPGTSWPGPRPPSARRGQVTRGRNRASTHASSPIRTRNSWTDPRKTSPARAPKRSKSPAAGATVPWRRKPPGWAARATVAHDPPYP